MTADVLVMALGKMTATALAMAFAGRFVWIFRAWLRDKGQRMAEIIRLAQRRDESRGAGRAVRALALPCFATGYVRPYASRCEVEDRDLEKGSLVRGVEEHRGAGFGGGTVWIFEALCFEGQPCVWLPRDACTPEQLAREWMRTGASWCVQIAYEEPITL